MEATVGIIGLGGMGTGMAKNLLEDCKARDKQLMVFNRTTAKSEPLRKAGAHVADSVGALAAACELVLVMLANDEALWAVFEEALPRMRPGGVFVDCSTVYPATTKDLAAKAIENGKHYLSCPVFGRPDVVATRKCVMVMAGPPEIKARVRPLLEPLGRAVLDAGDSVEEGSILKLVGNFFIAGAIELLAEGMTLSDAAGLQREKLLEWLNLMIPGVIFEGYGGRMAKGLQRVDGEGFAVDMAIKDASHIQRLAQETRASVPTIATVLDHLKGAQAKGRGDWDWSAVAATVREASGRNAEP